MKIHASKHVQINKAEKTSFELLITCRQTEQSEARWDCRRRDPHATSSHGRQTRAGQRRLAELQSVSELHGPSR
jgi:hypothetical protein